VLKARGDAESERVRAEGHKAAADLLAANQVAVKLAEIDRTGHALDSKKAFFFGADAKDLGSLLASSVADNVLGNTAPAAASAPTPAARPAPAAQQPAQSSRRS